MTAKIIKFMFATGFFLGISGWAQNAPTGLLCDLLAQPENCLITDAKPDFGWIMNSTNSNEVQSAYQVLASASVENLLQDKGDMWDSGKVSSGQSINVGYQGARLLAAHSYWWKVRTWDKEGRPTSFSEPQRFNTGELNRHRLWPGESRWVQITNESGKLFWGFEDRPPVAYHGFLPVKTIPNPDGSTFLDFDRAAFAALELTLTWQPSAHQTNHLIQVEVGEQKSGDSVDQKPGGGIIYACLPLELQPGRRVYSVPIPRFKPRYPESQSLPAEMPEVIPFRYCQMIPGSEKVTVDSAKQLRLNVAFNDQASCFDSSSEALNRVYDLCKYSIKVNTFNGDYAGSERERMLYEADAYIEQVSHYAVDREFAVARYSTENMIYHATWPTEWIPHCVFMAYADYLYTGNTQLISEDYDELKPKTLLALAGGDGLISSRTGLQTPQFLKSIHYQHGQLRDIVDWPVGETDGFGFTNVNTVVNAFHYRALILMSKIADALNKSKDATFYADRADQVKRAFNQELFDARRGIYTDGAGASHASFHANLFALAFGLVPEERRASVVKFIKAKGMACSVYPTIYLLESLYEAGEDQFAVDLMTSDSDRSWLNMIRVGSTVTTEAWDAKYKRNEGWTHAWSTAPVEIIPRKLMGIEPLEPGFGKVLIEPRPGKVERAKVILPTIRGPISVAFERGPLLKDFHLTITLPANMSARIGLPALNNLSSIITCDGRPVTSKVENNHLFIDEIGSGTHTFTR